MTPTVNVNLSQRGTHPEDHETPILLPCPIPRSVTFGLPGGSLGGCDCLADDHLSHRADCRSRPVRVSCSISGKTWEESEVFDIDKAGEPFSSGLHFEAALHACRDRWALVNALVLGHAWTEHAPESWDACNAAVLFAQRNAVYAALADMARAEEAEYRAWLSLPDAVKRKAGIDPYDPEHERTPAGEALWCYVSHLIEQVGSMP